MYEQALDMMAEPAYIKANLPIAFVAEQAGVKLIAGEGRLQGVCPFHADSNPSFDIYPWGNGERFGCFACGAGGDVLDFIQRRWGLGFREACEMAHRGIVKLRNEGWSAPILSGRFEWDAAAAEDMLRRAEIAPDPVSSLIGAKGWKFPAHWLVTRWGCRTLNGQLLVPIRDWDASLVGVKHRRLTGAGSLITLPGSRLRSTLYGLEYGVSDTVLLTEGESDAWTASWALQGTGVSVLSVPAGAGAAPTRLDALSLCDRIYLAFDGDEAGQASAGRWAESLGHRATVIQLPTGQDITSIEARQPGWVRATLEAQ